MEGNIKANPLLNNAVTPNPSLPIPTPRGQKVIHRTQINGENRIRMSQQRTLHHPSPRITKQDTFVFRPRDNPCAIVRDRDAEDIVAVTSKVHYAG